MLLLGKRANIKQYTAQFIFYENQKKAELIWIYRSQNTCYLPGLEKKNFECDLFFETNSLFH